MKLRTLLGAIGKSLPHGASDIEINEICEDSRLAHESAIFVAIRGNKLCGEDYILDAYKNGVRVFVTENENLKIHDALIIKVKNARKALAVLCARLYGNPEKSMKIIGITGTNGKSTTGFLLSKILKDYSVKNIFIGTFGILSDFNVETKNTTPSPTCIFPSLRRALNLGIRVAIIEVSSQALKDFRVYGIPFFITVFTSLGFDHIGRFEHTSFKDYVSAKRSLFTSYNSAVSIVNGDDAYSSYIASGASRTVKCGFYKHNDLILYNYNEDIEGFSFEIGDVKVRSNLNGQFNAINLALSLVAASIILKSRIENIAKDLNFRVKGRFEKYFVNSRHIIIDYAHTPESFMAISTLSHKLYKGRQIAVFGSVQERGYGRRRALAIAAEKVFDYSIITGDDVSGEEGRAVCEEIYSYFFDRTRAEIVTSRERAIERAFLYSEPNDVILLLGRGHENTIIEDGVVRHFCEEEILENMRNY